MAAKNKIITFTNSKVILKWNRINEALTKEEKLIMDKLVEKIRKYQIKVDKLQ